jgi:hypothetical protein
MSLLPFPEVLASASRSGLGQRLYGTTQVLPQATPLRYMLGVARRGYSPFACPPWTDKPLVKRRRGALQVRDRRDSSVTPRCRSQQCSHVRRAEPVWRRIMEQSRPRDELG